MPTLYDHRGRPLETQALDEELAPALATVRPLISETVGWVTPARLSTMLRAAGEGDIDSFLTLADEMEEREPHYGAVISTRKLTVSGLPVNVEAADEDKRSQEIADFVRGVVEAPEFGDLVEDLMDGVAKGYSVCEIMWRRGKRWTPERYLWRDPRWFQFNLDEQDEEIRLRVEGNLRGEPLAPFKFIVHTPRTKTGPVIKRGVARRAAVSYMCKSYALRDWMRFAELFGMPIRIGRYGANATKDEKEVLRRAVMRLGADAAAIIPKEMEVELQNVATGNNGDKLFAGLADFLDRQTSKAVLGQTMTTDDGSSYAQAQVHDEVRDDIKEADAKRVGRTIQRDLIRPLVDLNFGPQERYPTVRLVIEEPEDTKATSETVGNLVNAGVRLKASEVRKRCGFVDPEEGDEIITPPSAAPTPESPASPELNRRLLELALNRAGPSVSDEPELDAILEDHLRDWRPQMQPVIDPVEAALAASSSYTEFAERLRDLAGTLDTSTLVESIARATFKARALGDVQDNP